MISMPWQEVPLLKLATKNLYRAEDHLLYTYDPVNIVSLENVDPLEIIVSATCTLDGGSGL